jgi:type VI secretion system protein ImpA
MSTAPPAPFDLDALLRPVSAERPAGEDLRYEGTYDRIREARREDDPRLSRGIYETELKRADWPAVEATCVEALTTRTKDLQVAAWLLEAWLHLYGFAGVREGLWLLAALCESFWDELYPRLDGDDGGAGARTAPVEWVNEKLPLRLKQVPVTAPQANDVAPYSYADWEGACHLDNLAQKDPKAAQAAEARGRVTLSQFSSSLMLTASPFYVALHEQLGDAVEACATLEILLDERCGPDAPSLSQFRESLVAVQRLVADVLRSRPGDGTEGAGAEEDDMRLPDDPDVPDDVFRPAGPIRSRAEAYRRLAEAADYLMRTEPHSPTPYLVKRAVEWGGMSLHEVLQQIVRNDGELQELTRLLRLNGPGGRTQ